jgi:hypothetical protein
LLEVSQGISGSLQEKHRDVYIIKMSSALLRRLPGGVQWKAEKGEATDILQRDFRLRLGAHSAPERPAARDERNIRQMSRGLCHGGTHGSMSHRGRIGPLQALLHVGELKPQRGDISFGQSHRNSIQEGVYHSRSCAMRQNVASK